MSISHLRVCVLVLAAGAACSSADPESSELHALRPVRLSEVDAAWFRGVMRSDAFTDYLTIPSGSVRLERLPRAMLTKLAMTESFLPDADWRRIWRVAAIEPDEFSGVAVLNYLVICKPTNFVAFDLEAIPKAEAAMGLEAALFAHVEDEPSRPSPFNPFNWIEDTAGYHFNSYATCAEFLSARNRGRMALEWERLARFRRNTEIRHLAERSLEQTDSRAGAEPFTRMVDDARRIQKRFLGQDPFQTSASEVLGDRREVRNFEIRFFSKDEPVDYYIFLMIGQHPKFVNHEHWPILPIRIPVWPHVVSIEGGTRFLNKVQELFDVLEGGEPGEVLLEHERFLIVRGEYSGELAAALPRGTRLSMVPQKRLLVLRVLDEQVETTRAILASAK